MRNSFGDYRSKMQEEERRMSANAGRVAFQAAASSTSKSQFLRKAIIKPSGEEFRFNFEVDKLTISDKDLTPAPPVPTEPPKETPHTEINSFHYQPSNNGFRFNFGDSAD